MFTFQNFEVFCLFHSAKDYDPMDFHRSTIQKVATDLCQNKKRAGENQPFSQ